MDNFSREDTVFTNGLKNEVKACDNKNLLRMNINGSGCRLNN